MRVAIITAGLPRFTRDFITVLNQLKGFDTADLYVCLWNTDWASSEEQASNKISKILPSNITLKRLSLVDQPKRILPHNRSSEELQWWYDRRLGQIHCLKMAFDLIDEPYDIVVRVRPDGSLDRDVDISTLDFSNNNYILGDYDFSLSNGSGSKVVVYDLARLITLEAGTGVGGSGTSLWVDDQNGIIKSLYTTNNIGLKLDFVKN